MKAIIFLIILVFAVFGFSEFLHLLKLRLIFPRRRLCAHFVINLQNDTAEKQLLYVCEQYKWHGKSFADFIVPFCDNLDDDTFERTREIAQEHGIKFPERI